MWDVLDGEAFGNRGMSAMDRMGLEKKARKRILITGVIGIVLILTDFAVSAANQGDRSCSDRARCLYGSPGER